MSSSNVIINDKTFIKSIEESRQRIQNLKPVMQVIAQDMMTTKDMNFRNQQSPDGVKWDLLTIPTINARRNKKKTSIKILQDTGRLKASFTTESDNKTAKIGSNVEYAAIHQYGGTINKNARSGYMYFGNNKYGEYGLVKKKKAILKKGVTYQSHTIVIPQRQMIGLTDAKKKRYSSMITNYIVKGVIK